MHDPYVEFLNLRAGGLRELHGYDTKPKCVRKACTLDLFVVGPAPMMRFPPPNSCFTGSAISSKPCNPPSPLSTWRKRERRSPLRAPGAHCDMSLPRRGAGGNRPQAVTFDRI